MKEFFTEYATIWAFGFTVGFCAGVTLCIWAHDITF